MDLVDIWKASQIQTGTNKLNAKFMQTLEKGVYMELRSMAKERGVTVQEFLRAVIVPDWMRDCNRKEQKISSRSRTR